MISMTNYISINVPPILRREADLFVKGGYFTDRSELIRAAMREYLEKLSSKKVDIAVQLYRENEVSLAGAAQIANRSIHEMKLILRSRGIQIKYGPENESEAIEEYDTAREIL